MMSFIVALCTTKDKWYVEKNEIQNNHIRVYNKCE